MKHDPLIWIAGAAIVGCLLIVLASIMLKTRKPLDRNHVERLVDEAHKKNQRHDP
jgi:beta-lactamase regulating signal transducer with metallopeptidase domain